MHTVTASGRNSIAQTRQHKLLQKSIIAEYDAYGRNRMRAGIIEKVKSVDRTRHV